ncbi:helix-turn-helix domain-containing protein [Micromonospora sp. CPCC 205558]|uniref:helix-turn-helix domain-containing protein n=1 Tax=Micromonospora sp. CPCC 205558 TaxID=3122403 RepID=UPI003FA5CB72
MHGPRPCCWAGNKAGDWSRWYDEAIPAVEIAYEGCLAEERKRLGLTQRQVAELMGVTPGRVSQIENGDLEANEVATLSRYARALGARMRIIFDYGDDLRQIA